MKTLLGLLGGFLSNGLQW